MLLPTIGVVGEIPAASFICLVLGLLRMPLSASAPLVFFFSFFLFLFLFWRAIIGIFAFCTTTRGW